MRKIEIWVATNKVGSTCTQTLELDEEELEYMDQTDIEEMCNEMIYSMIDSGWRFVD